MLSHIRKALAVLTATAAFAFVPAEFAQALDAGPTVVYCTPTDTRTYTSTGNTWYAYDSGTLDNSRGAGTISQSYTHTSNRSLTTTVSAELGLKVSSLVTEVNTKFGISAAVTASYTTSMTFTVTAPPHTTVHFRNGILRRTYSVKRVRRADNCVVTTTYGTASVADSYAQAWS